MMPRVPVQMFGAGMYVLLASPSHVTCASVRVRASVCTQALVAAIRSHQVDVVMAIIRRPLHDMQCSAVHTRTKDTS